MGSSFLYIQSTEGKLMLKRDITYEDFDGNQITETFYFNISKPELIELEVEVKEGFSEWMQKIIKAEDYHTIIKEFKRLVLFAYGERSEDGKRFIKNEELREAFSQTNAYNELFMELAMDDGAAAQFVLGIMPKDMVPDIQKQMATKTAPPMPPAPPTTQNA